MGKGNHLQAQGVRAEKLHCVFMRMRRTSEGERICADQPLTSRRTVASCAALPGNAPAGQSRPPGSAGDRRRASAAASVGASMALSVRPASLAASWRSIASPASRPAGADGAGRTLQRMGGVHPGPARSAPGMDGAQMADALLNEKHQQLAFEIMVVAGLAGEMWARSMALCGHGFGGKPREILWVAARP